MNKLNKILIFTGLLFLVVLTGCSSEASVTKINPQQYDELSAQEDIIVIDVHVPEQEHLPNTDYVISYLDSKALQQVIPDKDTKVIIYCRSGSMSAQAAQDLVDAGYTNVYDLQGGRNAYIK